MNMLWTQPNHAAHSGQHNHSQTKLHPPFFHPQWIEKLLTKGAFADRSDSHEKNKYAVIEWAEGTCILKHTVFQCLPMSSYVILCFPLHDYEYLVFQSFQLLHTFGKHHVCSTELIHHTAQLAHILQGHMFRWYLLLSGNKTRQMYSLSQDRQAKMRSPFQRQMH